MGDFDYLAQDRALSRAEARSLVPPDDVEHVEDCRWRQGKCTCPTLAELKAWVTWKAVWMKSKSTTIPSHPNKLNWIMPGGL